MGLKEQLSTIIPENRITLLSDHFDVIGDIAVLSLDPVLKPWYPRIAATVRAKNHHIKTVINKTGIPDSDNRTAHYEILDGNDTITTYREFGFSYRLDIRTVFFHPGLADERRRIAELVQPGERVFIPFCGAGPFAIPVAAQGSTVIAMDLNPEACRWCRENIRLNDAGDRIDLMQGNAFAPPFCPGTLFDRIIIPTPYGMDRILDLLAPFCRPGGMIHFYTFKNKSQIRQLEHEYEKDGFSVRMVRRCGNVAPAVSRWVFDLEKKE